MGLLLECSECFATRDERGLSSERLDRTESRLPKLDEDYGPDPFTEKTEKLVLEGMRHFETLYYLGLAKKRKVPRDAFGPSPAKCRACAFFHACPWRVEG